jgi:hypothetical protein
MIQAQVPVPATIVHFFGLPQSASVAQLVLQVTVPGSQM